MEILDKMFVEDATESKHVDEHDCTRAKRKHGGDDNQSAAKTKCEEIVVDKSVNGDFIIHCGHCNYKNDYKYNLKVHMERKHSNTKVEENHHTETFKETVQCNDLF